MKDGEPGAATFKSLMQTLGKLVPDCTMQLEAVNSCRRKVAAQKRGHCSEAMDVFFECAQSRRRATDAIFEACGSNEPSGGYASHKQILMDYRTCLEEGKSAQVCLAPLEKFVRCAEGLGKS
jgi:hypothetical protein